MKTRHKSLFVAFLYCGLLLQTDTASAAEVTYSSYTATGSADTSWVGVSGYDSIVAGNAGGASTSFGGVTWGAMTTNSLNYGNNGVTINYSAPSRAWAATGAVFFAGGPTLLNSGAYSLSLDSSGVDYMINLSGLTIGKQYKVQFVMADTRGNNGYATILSKGGNVTGDSATTRYSYTDGQFAVITATFTADATSAQFQPGQRWFDPLVGLFTPNQTFVSGVQVLAISDPFLAWISAPNWPGLADRSASGDPDHDGITNLMEYVLQGGDPSVASTAILPTSATTATDLVFTYYRRAAATGVAQTFQYSPNLGITPWAGLAIPGGSGVLVTDQGSGIDKVEITAPKDTNTQLFGRLQVTKP